VRGAVAAAAEEVVLVQRALIARDVDKGRVVAGHRAERSPGVPDRRALAGPNRCGKLDPGQLEDAAEADADGSPRLSGALGARGGGPRGIGLGPPSQPPERPAPGKIPA